MVLIYEVTTNDETLLRFRGLAAVAINLSDPFPEGRIGLRLFGTL